MKQGNLVGRLLIRILEHRDLDFARMLHNDDSTLLRLTDVEHVTELQQEQWFKSISTSKKCKRYTVLDAETERPIGVFRVDMIDLINKSCCVGLDIAPDMRCKGYAREIYSYFLNYYFLHCGFNRLYLAVLETNDVGKNLYASIGFKEEGLFREAVYRNGQYSDLIWMGILRRDFDETRKHNPNET
mgnify:FL=1